jgi:hypothetical protein
METVTVVVCVGAGLNLALWGMIWRKLAMWTEHHRKGNERAYVRVDALARRYGASQDEMMVRVFRTGLLVTEREAGEERERGETDEGGGSGPASGPKAQQRREAPEPESNAREEGAS